MLSQYVSFSVLLLLVSFAKSTESKFLIPYSENEITLDGEIETGEWEKFASLEHLTAPWENDSTDQTEFKAFVSADYFNFSFQVTDLTMTTVPFEKELSVASGDRVELFFASDTTLTNYYCVEMDPNGNVLDYSAEFYRDFDEAWDFKSTKVVTKVSETGYTLEGRISLKELTELGILNPFYLGIFRADFKKPQTTEVSWYSWVKPQNPTPDFHIPSAFGEAEFKKASK
ncbi:sugar-binding protein [uncultured Cyclobacterium sp.]|uniref:sugar-binding protein n=1 Tax=uncultured Cyclobacterium sp. TaxID=453820 RepID=UPI0030EDAD6E|tara:strand:- start:48468 stop:49154 length:687 start_codon:yes stop_codon:yes gene_type:complete